MGVRTDCHRSRGSLVPSKTPPQDRRTRSAESMVAELPSRRAENVEETRRGTAVPGPPLPPPGLVENVT
jgi:hypothetical protein